MDRLTSDNGHLGLPLMTQIYGVNAGGNRTSLDDNLGGLITCAYVVRDVLATFARSGSGVALSRRAGFSLPATWIAAG